MKILLSLILLVIASCAHRPGSSGPSYDSVLSGFTYPFPVKSLKFTSQKQNLSMAYLHEVPPSSNGKTVILLHGKNFGAWYWERVMKDLLRDGYSVIAPDQIGFGKSTKPTSYQYSFQELARNTKNLLDHLGIKTAHVVGHSMGGMLATRFALMYPESTETLTLINPIGLEDWKTKVPYRTVDEVYSVELTSTPDKIRDYQKASYYNGEWKPEYETMIEAAKGQTRHEDHALVAWNSALTSDMIFTQPVVYEFPLVRNKTLLIIGTRDRTAIGKDRVPESERAQLGNYEVLGKKTHKLIYGSKLVELSGIGHMPMIENYEGMMKPLREFLKP